MRKELYHKGLATNQTAIKQGGLVPGCFEGNSRRVYFTLVNRHGPEPLHEVQGLHSFKA